MNQTLPVTSALSPSFERARKLSRVMAVIFTFGFWLMLAVAFFLLLIPFASILGDGSINLLDASISLNGLSVSQRLSVLLAAEVINLPVLMLMHHTRRVFGHFARGEIFVPAVIGHIQRAGVWLIVSCFAGIAASIILVASDVTQYTHNGSGLWPLTIGIVTYIAAHVMAEAQRIAAEHAEIV